MKIYLTTTFIMLTFWIVCTSCNTDDPIQMPVDTDQTSPPGNLDDSENNNDSNDDNTMDNNLKISIGLTSFNATLDNNVATKAFKALLPMTINMSELNGNEKYYYLRDNLPTASSNPGAIRNGDLMLYGSSCVVLFYKSFSTSFSYTRLGRVDNPSGLASALGSGNVSVTFELQ